MGIIHEVHYRDNVEKSNARAEAHLVQIAQAMRERSWILG